MLLQITHKTQRSRPPYFDSEQIVFMPSLNSRYITVGNPSMKQRAPSQVSKEIILYLN